MSLPEHIVAGEYSFPLEVRRHKQARRMTLRYHPLKDTVGLTLPKRCAEKHAVAFLNSRRDWLEKQLGTLPPRIPLTFGAVIPVLGAWRRLTPAMEAGQEALPPAEIPLIPGLPPCPALPEAFSLLTTPAKCEAVATARLKSTLNEYLIDKIAEMDAKQLYKNKIKSVNVDDFSGRWGACAHDGALNFSWRLVFAPREVLDYVIAHELAHLLEMNHSAVFWNHVAALSPDYASYRGWLTRHGRILYRFGARKASGL